MRLAALLLEILLDKDRFPQQTLKLMSLSWRMNAVSDAGNHTRSVHLS